LETECEYLKDQLIADICTSGITYWEEWPAVQAELERIQKADWTLLKATDVARLQHRSAELALPAIQQLYLGKRNY
jgi:hypothetical protein